MVALSIVANQDKFKILPWSDRRLSPEFAGYCNEISARIFRKLNLGFPTNNLLLHLSIGYSYRIGITDISYIK